jgi:hypothetical protein
MQLGHDACDLNVVGTVADYEASNNVGLGRDSARIFPAESCVVCYGKKFRGAPMAELPSEYIKHHITALKSFWRPWFAEAAAIWEAKNPSPSQKEEVQASRKFQEVFGNRERHKRAWNTNRQPLGASYQSKHGGFNNSRHPVGASVSLANGHNGLTSVHSTVHCYPHPSRRYLIKGHSSVESPSQLERGQSILPSTFILNKKEQSSTPAPVEQMDPSV